MKAFKLFVLSLLLVGMLGCANLTGTVLGDSPEAQIKAGADAGAAATVMMTTLARNQKITVVQFKTYRNMLGASNEALKDANTNLLSCRTLTNSTANTSPDPCWLNVSDVVKLALDNIGGIKKTLESK